MCLSQCICLSHCLCLSSLFFFLSPVFQILLSIFSLCCIHFSSPPRFDEISHHEVKKKEKKEKRKRSNWLFCYNSLPTKTANGSPLSGLFISIFALVKLLVNSLCERSTFWKRYFQTVLHFVSLQALELRESCVCPALPATDPRAVFSKSVHVLLENAKNQGRAGQEGARKLHLPHSPAPLPAGLPAALLAQTSLLPFSNVDQESKEPVPKVALELDVATPTPAPAEGDGHQNVAQSWQGC